MAIIKNNGDLYFRPKPAAQTPPTKKVVTPEKKVVTKKVTTSNTTTKPTVTPAKTTTTATVTPPTVTAPPTYNPASTPLRGASDLAGLYGGITFDENEIRSKFDAATKAEYNMLNNQYDTTANKFFGQMYGAENTALDTIRRSNAQAVATGASRGIQAANELSSILGLEKTAGDTATQLAADRNLLVDKEAAAYTKNVVDALTTSNQTKQALGTLGANLYASDTQFDVGEMNYYASLNQADKALEGSKYTADSNLTGTKYASDANVKAAGISAQGTRDAAAIAGKYSVQAAKEANAAQSAYYSYMTKQSTGNAQTDYEKGMTFLQNQYTNFMDKKDYENAAVWYSHLTGMDYKTSLKQIKNSSTVLAGLSDVSQQQATKNSFSYRGYQAMMP